MRLAQRRQFGFAGTAAVNARSPKFLVPSVAFLKDVKLCKSLGNTNDA
jgi:hypothetical protein